MIVCGVRSSTSASAVVGRVDEPAHDALGVGAARLRVRDVRRSATRPTAARGSCGCAPARSRVARATSARELRAMNVVDGDTSRSGSSLPRRFTPTVPCSTSASPTTSTYGTFSVLARRMRAPSAPCATVEHLGAKALGLQPVDDLVRVVVVAVGDRAARSPAPARATPGTRRRSARRAPRRTARSSRTARGGS